MRWLIPLVLCMSACPSCPGPNPNPPVPPPPIDLGSSACASPVEATPQDVCDGIFTADGYACTQCKGGFASCVDKDLMVYCIGAATCLDAIKSGECRYEIENSAAAAKKNK